MTPPGVARRPSRFAADFEGLLALFRAVAGHDGGGLVVLPDDVRAEYVDDEPGWIRSHWVWEAEDGRLAAVSAVWYELEDVENRAYGHIDVHPKFRQPELEDEVAQALQASALQLVGRSVSVLLNARESQPWKTALLDRNGYAPDRFFHRMARDLTAPIPDPATPDGYEIRPLAGDFELPAWHAAFDEAFAGHYDTPRFSAEERRHKMTFADYLPEGDLVAIGPDQEIAGVAWNFREEMEDGTARGNVNYIAVRPAHRGKGVARALLLTSLKTLRGIGLDSAVLAVDSGNETNALRLYESAGFQKLNLSIVYRAEVG